MKKSQKKKKKEKPHFHISITVIIIIILFLVLFATMLKSGYRLEISKETQETIATEREIGKSPAEEQNIAGRAIKLDGCLQDCQYKVCNKNCGKDDGSLESKCFRDCLDECNSKCLKVYGWG